MNFCNDFCYGKICFAKIDIKCPFTMEGRTSEIKAFDVNSKLSENLASHINIFKKGGAVLASFFPLCNTSSSEVALIRTTPITTLHYLGGKIHLDSNNCVLMEMK